MAQKTFGPLNHFDYAVVDSECSCRVCEDWRTSSKSYEGALAAVVGHPRSCMCVSCRAKYVSRSVYIAALNRRDLYCEASFHATHNDEVGHLGTQFMGWIGSQVIEPPVEKQAWQRWWEIKAPVLPLATWVSQFIKSSCVIAVSGATAA